MLLNFQRNDILIILSLSLPKFVVGFITSMVIPIFPSLIKIHFNNTKEIPISNFSSISNNSEYNYYQLSILYVAKNLCQIVTSPIIGCFVEILGSLIVLSGGIFFQALTIIVYGLGNVYSILILGRIFEAIGGTAIICSTSAFVAYHFKDHKQQGFVYGIIGLSYCVGSAIGPAYGGVVYQFYGEKVAFLSVLSIIFVEFIFVISVIIMEKIASKRKKEKLSGELENESRKDYINSMENEVLIFLTEVLPINVEDEEICEEDILISGTPNLTKPKNSLEVEKKMIQVNKEIPTHCSVLSFFKDPYFLISLGTFPVILTSIFLLFSSLPRYMAMSFNSSESQQGLIWILTLIGYVLGFISGNVVNSKFSTYRHIFLVIYFYLHALAILCIPFMPTWWSIAIPLCVIVHVHLISDVVMSPILAKIVETRHSGKFGVMSGIIMMTLSITAALGSFLGPILLSTIGFMYTNIGVCVINVIYVPLCLFLGKFCNSK